MTIEKRKNSKETIQRRARTHRQTHQSALRASVVRNAATSTTCVASSLAAGQKCAKTRQSYFDHQRVGMRRAPRCTYRAQSAVWQICPVRKKRDSKSVRKRTNERANEHPCTHSYLVLCQEVHVYRACTQRIKHSIEYDVLRERRAAAHSVRKAKDNFCVHICSLDECKSTFYLHLHVLVRVQRFGVCERERERLIEWSREGWSSSTHF